MAKALSPPATPSNLAATVVPIMTERFGASMFILELTYEKIWGWVRVNRVGTCCGYNAMTYSFSSLL